MIYVRKTSFETFAYFKTDINSFNDLKEYAIYTECFVKGSKSYSAGDHEIKDGDLIRFNRTTGHRTVEEVGVISLAPKPPSKTLKFSKSFFFSLVSFPLSSPSVTNNNPLTSCPYNAIG